MRVAFVSVGDPQRRTGGYLYHARIFAGLRALGLQIEELNAGPAAFAEQQALADQLASRVNPLNYDLIVVDALACVVSAPWLDHWRRLRPVLAMVHELPSVAGNAEELAGFEAPLLRADRLITVSSHGQALLEARGVPRERIRIVMPGSDRIEAGPRVPSWPLRVLCVAQWIPRKGLDTLIRAWTLRCRSDAVLELVGEQFADLAYAQQLQTLLAAAPACSPILVRGVLDDQELAHVYRSAAIFALPTRYEGYGMVFAEALLHGLPVLSTAIGPLPELLGDAAWLVPPDDLAALDAALTRLLSDAGLRDALAARALARAARLPTWQISTHAFQRVLEEATALRRNGV